MRSPCARDIRRAVLMTGVLLAFTLCVPAGSSAAAVAGRPHVSVLPNAARADVSAAGQRKISETAAASRIVHETLRIATATASPSTVRSVRDEAGGAQVVVLSAAAQMPKRGSVFVADASTREPGALGTVVSEKTKANGDLRLRLRRASLEAAYSSFSAQLDGTLGSLASQSARASISGHRLRGGGRGGVGLHPFDHVRFRCTNPATQRTVTHSIDLSGLHADVVVDTGGRFTAFKQPYIRFELTGRPKLDFGVKFSTDQSCTAAFSVPIPILHTPFVLHIGPDFTLHAGSDVEVNFEWSPQITYGFTRGRGQSTSPTTKFTNYGAPSFTGQGSVSLSLMLAVRLSLAGRIGIIGKVGPRITGTVDTNSTGTQTCAIAGVQVHAALHAHAAVLFRSFRFKIGSVLWPRLPFELYNSCATVAST